MVCLVKRDGAESPFAVALDADGEEFEFTDLFASKHDHIEAIKEHSVYFNGYYADGVPDVNLEDVDSDLYENHMLNGQS